MNDNQNLEKLKPRLVFNSTVNFKILILYIFLAIIAFIILAILGGWTKGNPTLSLLTMFYWCVVLIPIIVTDCTWYHPLMFQMIYEIPKVISLGTRAVGDVSANFNFRNYISEDEAVEAYFFSVIITCIGLIIEYIAVYAFKSKYINKKCIHLKKSRGVFLLFLFTVFCFVLLMDQLGGIWYVVLHFNDRLVEFSDESSQYLRFFLKYGILCVFYYYITNNMFNFRICGAIMILIFLVIGERGGLISTIILPFFIVYMLKNNKNLNFGQVFIGGSGLMVIYTAFGIIRDASQNVSIDYFLDNITSTTIGELSRILHFVISTELIWNVKEGIIDYTFGMPLLNIIYAPFPRSIFSWKPTYIAESFYVGSLILGENGRVYGLPPGTFAYGYLNFGLLGVIAFAIISGVFMGWLYNVMIGTYIKKREEIPNGNILLYATLLPFSMEILSTEVQINFLIILSGLWFILWVAKNRRRI